MRPEFERKLQELETQAKKLLEAGKQDESAAVMQAAEQARQAVIEMENRLLKRPQDPAA